MLSYIHIYPFLKSKPSRDFHGPPFWIFPCSFTIHWALLKTPGQFQNWLDCNVYMYIYSYIHRYMIIIWHIHVFMCIYIYTLWKFIPLLLAFIPFITSPWYLAPNILRQGETTRAVARFKFDDETVTPCSEYAAIEDNYGGAEIAFVPCAFLKCEHYFARASHCPMLLQSVQ